jgi:exosome complex component RRP45
VDVHVVDDCGNLMDCAGFAAMASLMHFRRPDVTVTGDDVVIVRSFHYCLLAN